MIKDYRRKPDWFERHAGLGGWLGSVGTVLAILAAWWLAHQEYLRAVALDNERTNSEIAMISRTANEFDKFVQQYIQAAESGDVTDNNFYSAHINDAEFHRTNDLNNMPITQWPSVSLMMPLNDIHSLRIGSWRLQSRRTGRRRFLNCD